MSDGIAEVPAPGSPAPEIVLPSTAGREVRLSAFRGHSNVLLAFFPLAFTSVCTAELCDMSGGLPDFSSTGTVVFGISVDSIPTLREFAARHAITVELLSDFKRQASRSYGVLMEDAFFARRAYFLIDRDGIVRWSHVESDLGHRRDNYELVAQVAALS